MKRLSIALAALGLSASAFAAYPAATNPTEVSVPQLPGGFFIGATAYYLQPSDTNGDLDYTILSSASATSSTNEIKAVEPGYNWSWGINAGYMFAGTGNDLTASYLHIDTDDTDKTSVATGVPGLTESIKGKARVDLDQIDVTAGQYINIGCRLTLHPNAGIRWASLERKLDTTAQVLSGDTVIESAVANEKSDFDGIGPIAGIDASYYIGSGIGAVAHLDSALLVGDVDSKTNITLTESPQPPVSTETKFGSNRRVVPVVDGKLGADWTYVFNNTTNSDLTLEAGWQLSNYFNAIDRVIVGPNGAALHGTSDVGFNGPYVNLTFHA